MFAKASSDSARYPSFDERQRNASNLALSSALAYPHQAGEAYESNHSCLKDSVQCTSLQAIMLQGSHCKQGLCTGHEQIANMLSDKESAAHCDTKYFDGLCTLEARHNQPWDFHSLFALRQQKSDLHRFNPIQFEIVPSRPVLDMCNFIST